LAAAAALCLSPAPARADGFDLSTMPQNAVVPSTAAPAGQEAHEKRPWTLDGRGINLFHNDNGSVSFSLYLLTRYLNQLPPGQKFTDHRGVVHDVNPRNDIYAPQRVLLSFFGWLFDPKFNYAVTVWTVSANDKVAVIGDLSYHFDKRFQLHAGTGGTPGTRSILGSHPYWLGTDRVLADEFFRPGFSFGVWALGELTPGFWYRTMLANNISTLGTTAGTNTRPLALSGSLWWMPTTHEFGPKGGYGDFEHHDRLAARFGLSGTHSRESKFTQTPNGTPGSAQIRLADSLLLFGSNALAQGVQVNDACFMLLGADMGLKYKGLFLHVEGYSRWLEGFRWDPVTSGAQPNLPGTINDKGFHVQTAEMVVPRKWEVYQATSWIFPQTSKGFSQSHEWVLGFNRYLWGNRNTRVNGQFIEVYRSPASSTFGYYQQGQRGQILSLAWSINI
jgi:hypothetical protein